MDKSIRIILFLIIGLVVVNFATTFLGNRSINDLRTDIKSAQASTDAAIKELKYSQMKLDSLKTDLRNFSAYVSDIHKSVVIDDMNKLLEDEDNVKKQKVLERKIDSLQKERDREAVDLQPIGVKH